MRCCPCVSVERQNRQAECDRFVCQGASDLNFEPTYMHAVVSQENQMAAISSDLSGVTVTVHPGLCTAVTYQAQLAAPREDARYVVWSEL